MGFRSTMISQDCIPAPSKEFDEKYANWIEVTRFDKVNRCVMHTKREGKFYDWEVFKDYQRLIDWDEVGYDAHPTFVVLTECGSVVRAIVSKDSIKCEYMNEGQELSEDEMPIYY